MEKSNFINNFYALFQKKSIINCWQNVVMINKDKFRRNIKIKLNVIVRRNIKEKSSLFELLD